jgi:hypothetical protein
MMARAAAAAGASEFFADWARAAHAHAPPEPDRFRSYAPKFFSPEEFRTLDAFTNVLIPTDDTPGAREAHVAPFIDFVVNAAAEYAPEMQKKWRDALGWLVQKRFADLPAPEQLTLVSSMAEPERDRSLSHEGFPAYRLIKDMTVRAFYTSRVGLIDVLQYQGIAYLQEFPACTHPEHRKVPA